jgi:excisionase family DNA binding protein
MMFGMTTELAYYTTLQAARRLGVTRQTVFRYCDAGTLRSITLPSGRRRIPVEAVEQIVKQGRPDETGADLDTSGEARVATMPEAVA